MSRYSNQKTIISARSTQFFASYGGLLDVGRESFLISKDTTILNPEEVGKFRSPLYVKKTYDNMTFSYDDYRTIAYDAGELAVKSNFWTFTEDYLRRILPEKKYSIPCYDGFMHHLWRFKLALTAYRRHVEEDFKALQPEAIWIDCLQSGPSYAEYIKKCRYYSFQDAIGIFETYEPNEYVLDNYKGYRSIFPESQLFPWKDIDDEDWRYVLESPPEINPKALDRFRLALRNILPDIKIEDFDVIDLLQKLSISSCYDSENNRVIENRLRIDRDIQKLLDSKDPFVFLRNLVYVSPGNLRDTFMSDLSTLCRINRGNYVYSQIARAIPRSAEGSMYNYRKATSFLRESSKDKYVYTMIDLKKCGFTVPHYLIDVVVDECIRKYGNVEGLDYPRFFNGARVRVDNSDYILKRGTGLGNANEIVTIIACTIAEMCQEFYPHACLFNDDSVYAFSLSRAGGFSDDFDDILHSTIINRYRMLRSTYESLGLIVNDKKSFSSRRCVFMENYYVDDYEGVDMSKNMLYIYSLSKIESASCILEAKSLYNSLSYFICDENIDVFRMYLNKLVRKFGYEFYPDESYAPYIAGGWFTPYKNNLDYSLVYIDETENDQLQQFMIHGLYYAKPPRFPYFGKPNKENSDRIEDLISDLIFCVRDIDNFCSPCNSKSTSDYSLNDLKEGLLEKIYYSYNYRDKSRYKVGTYLHMMRRRQNAYDRHCKESRHSTLLEYLSFHQDELSGRAIPECLIYGSKNYIMADRINAKKKIFASSLPYQSPLRSWLNLNKASLTPFVKRGTYNPTSEFYSRDRTIALVREYIPKSELIKEDYDKIVLLTKRYISPNYRGYLNDLFERADRIPTDYGIVFDDTEYLLNNTVFSCMRSDEDLYYPLYNKDMERAFWVPIWFRRINKEYRSYVSQILRGGLYHHKEMSEDDLKQILFEYFTTHDRTEEERLLKSQKKEDPNIGIYTHEEFIADMKALYGEIEYHDEEIRLLYAGISKNKISILYGNDHDGHLIQETEEEEEIQPLQLEGTGDYEGGFFFDDDDDWSDESTGNIQQDLDRIYEIDQSVGGPSNIFGTDPLGSSPIR